MHLIYKRNKYVVFIPLIEIRLSPLDKQLFNAVLETKMNTEI